MSKKISVYAVIIIVLLTAVVTFETTYFGVAKKFSRQVDELAADYEYLDKLNAVRSIYDSNYIGETDKDSISDGIIRGYIYGTGDEYGDYYTEEEYLALISDLKGELEGIGIDVVFDDEYQAPLVVFVIPGSPAEEAGLLAGDMIIRADGEETSKLGYEGSLEKLRGKAGTFAEFTVVRDLVDEIEFRVERRAVTDVTAIGRMYRSKNGENTDIGIIRILEFNASTPGQFTLAVKDLQEQGATKFIYDVRNNPGGDLAAIVSVLDYLLPEGPIVRLVDNQGGEEVENSGESFLDAPCAVLINGNSASAAELFASALKDYNAHGDYHAKLIEKKTYGKGCKQSILRLADNSAIKITDSLFNPPYSENFNGIGVFPDIEVDLPEELTKKNIFLIADEEDTQLIAAAEFLEPGINDVPEETGADESAAEETSPDAA